MSSGYDLINPDGFDRDENFPERELRMRLREEVDLLQAKNDKLVALLEQIRDIARADQLSDKRWAILAAILNCLTEVETGLPTMETLMVRDELIPPILDDPKNET